MRQSHQQQFNLGENWLEFDHAQELRVISELLDDHPTIAELVWQDLKDAGLASDSRGASGLTAEQVLRALMIKQLQGFSYRDLAFH